VGTTIKRKHGSNSETLEKLSKLLDKHDLGLLGTAIMK
jgi:hypothetical protein